MDILKKLGLLLKCNQIDYDTKKILQAISQRHHTYGRLTENQESAISSIFEKFKSYILDKKELSNCYKCLGSGLCIAEYCGLTYAIPCICSHGQARKMMNFSGEVVVNQFDVLSATKAGFRVYFPSFKFTDNIEERKERLQFVFDLLQGRKSQKEIDSFIEILQKAYC